MDGGAFHCQKGGFESCVKSRQGETTDGMECFNKDVFEPRKIRQMDARSSPRSWQEEAMINDTGKLNSLFRGPCSLKEHVALDRTSWSIQSRIQ